MKKYYRLVSRILFGMSLTMLFSFAVQAQDRSVTGTITDASTGEALPGVNIVIKGTTSGAVTDINGKFSLRVTDSSVIIFSYVGFKAQEILVGSRSVIDVSMEIDAEQLGEVVVIGYGTVEKKDMTGSIVSVGEDDFNQGVIASPQELLVGKAAGVVITTQGGAAGTGSTIRIRGGSSLRGNNDPLIVIDGMLLESRGNAGLANPLSTINPNDIETISVLKDASATAIYGSRASNGVIIVTTKKGQQGDPTVSYNGNVSVGVPVATLDVYDGDQYRALIQDRVTNGGLDANALQVLGTENTDWQDQIYQNAISHDHNVSVSGSLKTLPYRVSVGYTSQDGILKKNNFERTSLSANLSPSLLNDALKIDVNAKFSIIDNDFSNPDAIGSALVFDPTQPIRNGNTTFGGYTAWTNILAGETVPTDINGLPNNIATHNPVAQLEYRDNISSGKRYILGGKFDYSLPFAAGLTATLNLGYDYNSTDGTDIIDPLASWSYREPERNIRSYDQTRKNTLVDFYVNYKRELSGMESVIDITAGHSYQHFHNEGGNANRSWNESDPGADTVTYKNEYKLESYFGRLNYSLKDRYLLTVTMRADGSSRFSSANRWGLFPSVAFAWKINEEDFLSSANALDDLKLRIGWGQTGQQDIGDDNRSLYPYIPTYAISQQGAFYNFGGQFYPTQRPNAYDANIKWETTTTQNIGLDFGFLSGRVSGSIDFYKRETEDLLNEIPIAAGTNFSNFLTTNVGTLENKGVEVNLTGAIISKPDLIWELSGNLTYNQNKITKLTLIDDPTYPGYNTGGISGGVGNNVQINGVGNPANTFYLFQQVYDQNGMPIEGLYVDRTGTGGNVAGNELNKYYAENPAPDYLIGVSSRVQYKNVDFSFSGRFNLDNYVYNNNASNMALYQNLYNQSGYTANILTDVEKTGFTNAQYWSDFYLENASFFRMDFISVGYNFNQLITEKLSGRFSFTVQNAFVVTDYSGLDPEVDGGIDNNRYPRPRTFVFGLNLNF